MNEFVSFVMCLRECVDGSRERGAEGETELCVWNRKRRMDMWINDRERCKDTEERKINRKRLSSENKASDGGWGLLPCLEQIHIFSLYKRGDEFVLLTSNLTFPLERPNNRDDIFPLFWWNKIGNKPHFASDILPSRLLGLHYYCIICFYSSENYKQWKKQNKTCNTCLAY